MLRIIRFFVVRSAFSGIGPLRGIDQIESISLEFLKQLLFTLSNAIRVKIRLSVVAVLNEADIDWIKHLHHFEEERISIRQRREVEVPTKFERRGSLSYE